MRVPIRLKLVAVLACVVGSLSASASVAQAEGAPGPGWMLSANSFPTNMLPGSAKDEVQEVTVSATGGFFSLEDPQTGGSARLDYNATAAEMQTELEAELYGTGNVRVEELKEKDSAETHAWRVTLTGSLSDRVVSRMGHQESELTGGLATVTVTQATEGSPSGVVVVDVMNIGAGASGGPITVTDTLPPGVTAIEAGEGGFSYFSATLPPSIKIHHAFWDCTGNGPGGGVEGANVVTCTNNEATMPSIAGGGGNPGTREGPYPAPQVFISVNAGGAEASGLTNSAVIAGGGAPTPASTTDPIAISSQPAPFGFAGWHVWFSNADGTLDTQAGSHPYEATFDYDLKDVFATTGDDAWSAAGGKPGGEVLFNRTLEVKLPPGLVGNPNAIPQCTRQQLDKKECPPASQVGIITVTIIGGLLNRFKVFNMVPPAGFPSEIAFNFVEGGIETRLDTGVRSGSDYGLTTHIYNVPERNAIASVLTLWGEPGENSHNIWRNTPGTGSGLGGCQPGECLPIGGEAKPFLTLPTSCTGPLTSSIWGDVWGFPEITGEVSSQTLDSDGMPAGMTGCEKLQFAPLTTTSPDTSDADTPAGLTVEVKPSLGGLENPNGIGSSDIKDTTVTLPEGFVINPGQAAGLQACGPAEDGLTTEAEKAKGEEDDGPPSCPNGSKVGTVKIKTPLLEQAAEKELEGDVYVMQSNPPELKLLLAASGDGINLKLVGTVHLNEQTGQITTTFANTPELPFSDFKLSFSGGAQAALATPTQCGRYTSTASFTPWASPFVANFLTTSSFAITDGVDGGPCPPSTLPFSPSLNAGSTTDQAGGYTDFSLLLQAPDDQQRIEKLQFKTPEGLLGMISKVPLCGEPQAAQGECPEASQIGHTVVAAGPGPYPLVVPQPGQPPAPIYLTGPYEGAPYGLAIVVPLHVGPFTLQTQVVRAKIEVDPHSSQLTVTTNPLPQVIDGIPTDLRTINAVIDKPGFMFNPTNCSPMSFSGTAFSNQGTPAQIGSHFQMGSCQALKFAPDFKVFTSGQTSRANGASLDVQLLYPTGNLGANQASSQSNIQSVKVELPKQLPSRLTTLQKACTAAQFDSNPAGCPAASVVGHATAITPVLPVPLTGPAYFVSNGGEAFPNLIVVLQGYGVTIDLVGDTFISQAGITSSTFKQIPDVPISSFELALPEGPYSALAANGNLCKSALTMPTDFVAQNGATLDQDTKIAVTGCQPAIAVLRHRVKGRTATIAVSVPSAGRLVASGSGLSRTTRTANAAGTVTVTVALSPSEQRFLSHHLGRRLRATVKLLFTPKHGSRLSTSVTVLIR
jgi:hypothetical protein